MKRAVVVVAALFACAGSGRSWAQTNDVQYGSWQMSVDLVGPQGLGAGGAVVAAKDTTSSMALNPAVISTLRETEILGSGYSSSSKATLRNDANGSVSGFGILGGAVKLTPRVAVGGYVTQPRQVDTTLTTAALPNGTHLSGFLNSTVTDAGIVGAYELSPKVHIGGQLVWTHLKLEGQGNRFAAAGNQVLSVGTAAGQDRFVGNFGMLFDVNDSVTLGFAAVSGASWDATRAVTGPESGPIVDPSAAYQIRRPAEVSGGLAWQLSRHVKALVQVDYVNYGQVQSGLWIRDLAAAGGFAVSDAIEPRFGLEFSYPIGAQASLQLRGGLHDRGANAVKYQGTDPTEQATFPGNDRQLDGSIGASLVVNKFAVHAAASDLGETTRVSFGGSLRF
jgi:hypothetical protein